MKTINANVAPSLFISLNLASRRAYSDMDTADLKREDRRRQRRALREELAKVNFAGIQKDFGMPTMPTQKPLLAPPQIIQFAAKEPARFVTVAVTRKPRPDVHAANPFRRATVELVSIPVMA